MFVEVDNVETMDREMEDEDNHSLLPAPHDPNAETMPLTFRTTATPSPVAVSVQESAATVTGRPPLCIYLTCDDDHFTKFQVLLRKQIEFFETTTCPSVLHPKKQGRNKAIVLGQVGIRCMHCRLYVMQEQASKGAVYYPSTLPGIYQAAQNMATHHFLADQCPMISEEVKHELAYLNQIQEKKSFGGKDMWASKALALGVREDTIDGILRYQRAEERLEALALPAASDH